MGNYSIYTLIAFHGIALVLGYYAGLTFKPGVKFLPENRVASVLILVCALLLPIGTTAFFIGFVTGNRVAEEEQEDLELDQVNTLIKSQPKAESNA